MITIAFSVLLISALATAGWSYRGAAQLSGDKQTTLQVLSLCSSFIALAALADLLLSGLLLTSNGSDLTTLQRMLGNLAYYAAIPLIASTAVATGRKQHWSRPAWGRWLIALFALFELLRRMEYGAEYSQVMASLCVLAIALSVLRFSSAAAKSLGLIAASGFAIALLLFGHGSLLPELTNSSYYALALAASIPIYGYTLRLCLR
ncbi:MAG: hypothetical protein V7731_10240 [Amphritea sp.]